MDNEPSLIEAFFISIQKGYKSFTTSFKEYRDTANNKYNFQSLTPINNANIDVYKDVISFIFSQDDIKNIAISGPYSAGKSSLIETYKKQFPRKKFSHISLSHFDSTKNTSNSLTPQLALEGKILNQLIHQIPPNRIPRTKFKIKKKASCWNIIFNTLFLLSSVVSFIHIRFYNDWVIYIKKINNSNIQAILSPTTDIRSPLFSGFFFTFCVGVIIYKLIKSQQNKSLFKKIKFQGNEIEIFEDSDDSYFDKYLNEVLYLFENIGTDAIVFEDIDRFEDGVIFERLREINTLVNIHLTSLNKGRLRFFYLLRDDMFLSKDRTKFFDYIVPVIPVVDSSNSYDKLLNLLKKIKSNKYSFESSFLEGICLYVDDLRILKNIYNEFLVYFNNLNNIELDCNKMLAIISYKNIFPKDFSELQLNRGYVYKILNSKQRIIESEVSALEIRIKNIQDKLNNAQDEHLTSLEELNILYKSKIDTAQTALRNYSYNPSTQAYIKAENNLLDLKNKKQQRQELIEIKIHQKENALNIEISDLRKEIIKLQNKRLKDLITRENIDFIFNDSITEQFETAQEANKIIKNEYFDLLKYLLRNGYIDETYNDYITYFYEDSLNKNDKSFLRSVSDKKNKGTTYKLYKPELIIQKLQDYDFTQPETLNFYLIRHLLTHKEEIPTSLKNIISQLHNDNRLDLIKEYFDSELVNPHKAEEIYELQLDNLVKDLNKLWPELFDLLLMKKTLTDEQIKLYVLYSLYFSDEDTIKNVNYNNTLARYISENETFLTIENPDISTLISKFILLDILFEKLEKQDSSTALFSAVYEHSLYRINIKNIIALLSYEYNCTDDDRVKHENYSVILENEKSYLAEYIEKNIETYITVILENCGGMINDNIDAVKKILNNTELSHKSKECYIDKLSYKLKELDTITDTTLWPHALIINKIEYTAYNIISYFLTHKTLDNTIINFINSEKNIILNLSTEYIPDDTKTILLEKTIECSKLDDSKYEEILQSLNPSENLTYSKFRINELQSSKIEILINHSIITMNADNLSFLRDNYASTTIYFILNNIDDYINIQNKTIIDRNEILSILGKDIDDKLKESLSDIIKAPISIQNDKYSTRFKTHILTHHLDTSDIPYIIEFYESLDKLQETILFTLEKNKPILMSNLNKVTVRLVTDLIDRKKTTLDENVSMLTCIFEQLNDSQRENYFEKLNLPEFISLLRNEDTTINANKINEQILLTFKKHGIIESYNKAGPTAPYEIKFPVKSDE